MEKVEKAGAKFTEEKCKVRFTPYGTTTGLQMIGRSKAILKNAAGGLVGTIVYIVKGNNQSLLGLKDALSLGIVTINKDGVDVRDNLKGVKTVTVSMLSVQKKLENPQHTWGPPASNPLQLGEGSEVVGEDITTEAEGLVAEEEGDRTEQLELAVAEPRSLSPRERKKRKAAARKRKDKDFIYY